MKRRSPDGPRLTTVPKMPENPIIGATITGIPGERHMKSRHLVAIACALCCAGYQAVYAQQRASFLQRGPSSRDATPQELTLPSLNMRPVMFNTSQADAILANLQVFPADNPWNQVVAAWPLHPNSAAIISSIGRDKVFRYNTDMAFILVPFNQRRIDVEIGIYADESDPGPYPVPGNVPIEGWPVNYQRDPDLDHLTLKDVQRDTIGEGGDRHAIVVDPVRKRLYEFYQMKLVGTKWQASQASIFDLSSNALRPAGWTSADAAGLPIFPAVVRHDDLQRGIVQHAMRVTVSRTRRAYVYPARHYASSLTDADLPRMGERIRLKASVNVNSFSPPVKAILRGLQQYGMFVADNGIDWAISVAPDHRIPVLHEELRRIKGSDFEVVTPP